MNQFVTTADVLVESLIRHGVDTVFGLPGVQTYELFDSLARASNRIRTVVARHEQSTAYMAYGYAKSTGRTGVYTVVPGPGMLNSAAALCTAYGASTPILCLTGEVPSRFIGSGFGHLHELPDQLAILRGLTKWAQQVTDGESAAAVMREAFAQLGSGRPRPVGVQVPWDVLGVKVLSSALQPADPIPPPAPDPDVVTDAARLLAGAREPMIMVGSGALHASDEVLALAERLQAPVVSLRSGRGIVSDESPLGFNCVEGRRRWLQTDILIGIGTRLELMWFRWNDKPPGLRTVLIDIDRAQIERLAPTIGLHGDAKSTTRVLVERLQRLGSARPSRHKEFLAVKAAARADIETIRPHYEFMQAIRRALPRDGFLVEEICQAGFAAWFSFPVYTPRSFVTGGHQGTLGFGFPTALGVKLANPNRPVLAIAGDGGFMFAMPELATAVQFGINLVTVVFDNMAYGNVRRDQLQQFNGRSLGADLRNPDFRKLADSFGVASYGARTPAELERVIERAFDANAPALIVVPVDPDTEVSPWHLLVPHLHTQPIT
jgi:acetolactate synthase I/II/III large subunit